MIFFRQTHGGAGLSNAAIAIVYVMTPLILSDTSAFIQLYQMWNKISTINLIIYDKVSKESKIH